MADRAQNETKGIFATKLFAARGTDGRKFEIIAMVVLVAVMLLICWPVLFPGSEDEKISGISAASDGHALTVAGEEEKLARMLSQIQGAGHVEVMITFDGDAEKVPAYDSSMTVSNTEDGGSQRSSSQSESKQPATLNDDTIVLREKRPEVLGVLVVAQGAGDINVRMELARAVQVVLNVPASRVEICEMNNIKGEEGI